MVTKLSLSQIKHQMAALNAKAERLLKGRGKIVQQIRKQISAFDITAEDLFGAGAVVGAVAGQADVSHDGSKAKSKSKKPKKAFPAVKYSNGRAAWSGRGPMPRWLRDEISAGNKLADYDVEAGGSKVGGQTPTPAEAPKWPPATAGQGGKVEPKPKAAAKGAVKVAAKAPLKAAAKAPVNAKPAKATKPAPAKGPTKAVAKPVATAKPVAKPVKAAPAKPAAKAKSAPGKPAAKPAGKAAVKKVEATAPAAEAVAAPADAGTPNQE